VIGPERATMEVAGGHAIVMADWTAHALADAVTRAGRLGREELELARAWGAGFTWDRTVAKTRAMLVRLALSRA
jgi:hypothetical protein